MANVQVLYNSTDITSHVQFTNMTFTALVNGVAGTCQFRVRDDDSTMSFVTGKSIQLLIDSVAVWTGYLTSIVRVYAFPAAGALPARFYDLTGADLNILFEKRIVFNQTTPATVSGTLFAAGTNDSVAIAELMAHWLDLSGDSLDTSTFVTTVGTLDPAVSTRAWSGGWTWKNAMDTIAMLPAAIYYIDPERNLVYCDTDSTNASFGLSDQPNNTTTFGYREMEILYDGGSLCNDYFAWGFGYGSNTPVISVATDATSRTNHGLWQAASINYGVYKQGSVDRIAQSVVFGSPDSHRGAKDDRRAIMCTTYKGGLKVGQKVAFTSNVFGFTQTFPIRKMVITFDSPTDPKYELTMSFEIDAPWNTTDLFLLNWSFPPLPGLPIFPPIPNPCPQACLLTDPFNRTVSGSWGGDWTTSTGSGITMSVNGTQAINVLPSFSFYGTADISWVTTGVDNVHLSGISFAASAPIINGYTLKLTFGSTSPYAVYLGYFDPPDPYAVGDAGGVHHLTPSFSVLSPFDIRVQASATDFRVRGWQTGTAEPSSWDFISANPYSGFIGGSFEWLASNSDLGSLTLTMDSFDVNCGGAGDALASIVFDDFSRTTNASVSPWTIGTSSSGYAYINDGVVPAHATGTDGAVLYVGYASNFGNHVTHLGSGRDPWDRPVVTMQTRFRVGNISGLSTTYKLSWGSTYFQIDVADGTGITGEGGFTVSGATYVVKTDWIVNQWYIAELLLDSAGSQISARIYEDGSAPPPAQYTGSWVGGGPLSANDFDVTLDTASTVTTGWQAMVSHINFLMPNTGCLGIVPVIYSGTQYCQTYTNGTEYNYVTLTMFFPNSLQVSINGLTQRAGIDFFEVSIQSFRLASAPLVTDVIQACYIPDIAVNV